MLEINNIQKYSMNMKKTIVLLDFSSHIELLLNEFNYEAEFLVLKMIKNAFYREI